jgi:hypothetical protein
MISETLQVEIHETLKQWHNSQVDASLLEGLYLFQRAQNEGVSEPHQVIKQIILQALETLEPEFGEEAAVLRLHFIEDKKIFQVAEQLNLSEPTLYRKQRQGLDRLTGAVQAMETQARAEYQAGLAQRLPLGPDVTLIGVEAPLRAVMAALLKAAAPWLVSIEGLGGIGKTSLAGAVVRQPEAGGVFQQMAWVSAKQEELLPGLGISEISRPALDVDALTDALLEQFGQTQALAQSPQEKRLALSQLLKNRPSLIVVDNLETAIDLQTLLPALRELANPSKFLLTSRLSLRAHGDAFCLTLRELSREDTIRLIRHEAGVRGMPMLAEAPDEQVSTIYEAVGGNPLALKLVIGQIAILPLSQVLESLRQANAQSVNELYTYIFWQAWRTLSPQAQQVLLTMPLAQAGSLEQLASLAELPAGDLGQALAELARLSLVEVVGGLEERRYTIHRLTETFLLNEAIKW